MLNVFRSKDKAVRWLLGILLGVVALSMVTYLIPSYGDPGLAANSAVLAEVNGKPITAQFAQQTFQRIMGNTQVPREMLDVYFPQFIESMIQQRAAVYQAERMGLTVNDDELLNGLMVQNKQFFPNGKLADRGALEKYYQSQGQTLSDGIDDVKNQLMLSKLQDSLLENTVVGPKEVESEFSRKYDKAKVEYMLFAPEKFRGQVKLAPEQIDGYFKNNRTNFTLPEKYSYQWWSTKLRSSNRSRSAMPNSARPIPLRWTASACPNGFTRAISCSRPKANRTPIKRACWPRRRTW
jgi:peptidyl-prolyl cis-trans isomerase D